MEIAALIAAVTFAVLVVFLVPMIIRIGRAVAESERLMGEVYRELPPLVSDVRETIRDINGIVEQTQEGVRHANVLLHEVGKLGDTVQLVQNQVRAINGSFVVQAASWIAGVKAASTVIKERVVAKKHDRGGLHGNGGL